MNIFNDLKSESTVFRSKINDTKHKLWFVLDKNLVLPEYLVEYEYILKSKTNNKISELGDLICNFSFKKINKKLINFFNF